MSKKSHTKRLVRRQRQLAAARAAVAKGEVRRSALYLALAAGLGMSPYALAQDVPADADQIAAAADGNEAEEAVAGEQTAEEKKKAEAEAKRRALEEEEAALDRLEVRGFRQSIASSVATKRNHTSIVESVSAEDIGKLPDVSIAEAIARLPGVSAQRVDGRAQVVSVRGFGPDFSTALLNGREQVTTGDNRGVEFDQYPAELMGEVVVYKTPDSTLIGQGLAGTVDLRTIRPLDLNERRLNVNARYEFNEDDAVNPDGPRDGYRASAVYIDQFMDHTFGVTLGIAAQSTPTQTERFNSWGFPTTEDGGPFVIGGAKPFSTTNDLDRVGIIGTVEYAPNDRLHTSLDLSYSDFNEVQNLRGIEFPLFWSAAQLRPGFTANDGIVTEGVFDDVKGVMRNDRNKRSAQLYNAGWNLRYQFAENWGFETDVSYSRSERTDFLLETYTGTGAGVGNGAADALGFRREDNGNFVFSPSLDYGDPSQFFLTDPQGWGAGAGLIQAGFINAPETDDELTHIKFAIDRVFSRGFISRVTVGGDLSRRDKKRKIAQNFLVPAGGVDALPIPEEALLDNQIGHDFIGIPQQVTLDPLFLIENGFLDFVPIELSSFNVPQDWMVREEVALGFVKFDLDGMVRSVPVTGNFGLQVVYTDQTSRGFRVAGEQEAGTGGGTVGVAPGTFIPVRDGDEFTRLLPSANVIFDLPHEVKVRFGAARTLARARMDQLNAGLTLNANFPQLESTDPNRSFFSASGGNAQLKPTISNNVDLSFEKYFGDGVGYLALAGFYKDLQDFINPTDARLVDFSAFIDDFLTPEDQARLGTPLGLSSGPTNRGKGNIKGFEFTVSAPFSLFSEVLDGFGVISSVAYTDSKVLLGDDPNPISVPGLSDWVVNTTFYFEKSGFQARLGHRYRDSFLSEIFGLSATRITREAAGESVFDAQVSYEFKHGSLEGLTILLQANNLTDEPFVTFEQGNRGLVIDRQKFGRTYLLGASYRIF